METVIQNNSIEIDTTIYYTTRGWSADINNIATHTPPNSGSIDFPYQVTAGREYELSMTVSNISNGSVILTLGDKESTPITTNGYHQMTITPDTDGTISIWSDANVQIANITILAKITTDSTTVQQGMDTVAFNSLKYRWVSFRSYVPESGSNTHTDLITFKNGELWLHSKEATHNNFYGVQYSSYVKFPVSSVGVKTYQSIAIHSNKVLGTTEDGITTELGDISDLISYDFSTREGIHYANIIRDKLTNDLLQGRYIVIELTDEETNTEKLQIFKIVVKSVMNTPNE